ncbi:hypothetical protein PoB_002995300 [Plakobranchus ocellatus]|uniref:Uncharacterized protein n=1 Tax=Plakobranchus ocellatus TaxID=259542 RepID=A0AAV4A9Y3_9GAST|nr:hypothetical protein PoB_002995300 [Plakobranchus ocellatus]
MHSRLTEIGRLKSLRFMLVHTGNCLSYCLVAVQRHYWLSGSEPVRGYYIFLPKHELSMSPIKLIFSKTFCKKVIAAYCDFTRKCFSFLYIASPQQGDLRLLGPPSGQGAGSGARTRDRRVPADLRADSLTTDAPRKYF